VYLTGPTNVTKQVELISCHFTTSPGGRADGRVGGLLEKSTVRLTQPSLAGTWAELGNMPPLPNLLTISLISTMKM
jgi:hypothetical protein